VTYQHPLLESWPHVCVPGSRKPYPSSACEWLRRTAWLCFSLYLLARSPSSLSWDKSVACAWPSLLAQPGNHTHLADSSFCGSLKWPTEDFLLILKNQNQQKSNTNTFCLSRRTNVHSFTIRYILQLVLLPQGHTTPCTLNRWECGKSGRTILQTSGIPSLAALSVYGNRATCFVSKPMPSNPAYLQCKLYTLPKMRISQFAREDLLFHFVFK